jgi:GNAT superfamily N-acetyltransferase
MTALIRSAGKADAAVIADFNARLALESENKTLDPAVLALGVAAVLEDPAKGLYWLAEDHGRVVGQICVTFEWSDWRNGWMWWIQSVYVRPQARRKGVFRSLYEHVYKTAVAEGVIALRLYVEEKNHIAQQTYNDLGMEAMGFILYHKWPLA